jgi:hypothetical protein
MALSAEGQLIALVDRDERTAIFGWPLMEDRCNPSKRIG